jgi:ribosomal protein S18 acetylase RimI-like enzyme
MAQVITLIHSPAFAREFCSHRGWFVDLFVRESNALAISMYKRLGYTVFRRVLSYYGDNNEDALGESVGMPLESLTHSLCTAPIMCLM